MSYREGRKAAERLVRERACADQSLRPYVRLAKVIGRHPIPVAMLHYPGYAATPDRYAPLCSERDGPYGDVEWCHPDRVQLPLCAKCAALRGAP